MHLLKNFSACNYPDIPALGKWLQSGCMLLGRLKIYTVI